MFKTADPKLTAAFNLAIGILAVFDSFQLLRFAIVGFEFHAKSGVTALPAGAALVASYMLIALATTLISGKTKDLFSKTAPVGLPQLAE